MVLHCPACGTQHIDAPEEEEYEDRSGQLRMKCDWTNPPHRSHLCHACEHVWRPADVQTNGVAAVKTIGKNDSPIASTPASRQLRRDQIIDLISSVSNNSADHDVQFALRVLDAADAARKGGAAASPATDASEVPAIRESDQQLMRFYSVETLAALIDAQERHIVKLQAKLPPLRDEFPQTPRGA
jgi:hypothetical protein